MLEELRDERLKKLERLRARGIRPYPARSGSASAISEALERFTTLAKSKKQVAIAGRIMALRDQGSVVFADVMDSSGTLQVIFKKDDLTDFAFWKGTLDRGDLIRAAGRLCVTKRGEKSIEARDVTMLTKSLLPIPTEFYGLKDTETLLRKQYLDFIAHQDRRELFLKKAAFWQTTRNFLEEKGFLEVETPVLEFVPGGAEAEPFVTRYHALKEDVYLRISPELALKRLLVGGFEKVFEIGRVFRNEGIDAEHLQDYTQMEMYWAYRDYGQLMEFVETMVKAVLKKTFGTLLYARGGKKTNWGKKWARYDYCALFQDATMLDLRTATHGELLEQARASRIEQADEKLGRGRLIDLLYKKTVRPQLTVPGFLVDPPADVEPLAKRKEGEEWKVERFQLVAYGTELGKGFSELNDPLDQRKRFEEQMALRAAGDREAQQIDEDYLEAMEYGMPPAAGFAYSERLFAVLANLPVREAVLFPLTRRKA